MRTLASLVVTAAVLAALTACSGSAASSCDSGVTSGRASETVTATGDFGVAPTVTFPQPLIANDVQKSVLIDGAGDPVDVGQPILLEATIMSGTDGSVLQQTSYAEDGGSLYTVGDPGLPALGTGLECATVGSRVAIVASGEENAAEGAAISEDSVVYVIDVLEAFKSRADGAIQLPQAGLPTVVTTDDGTPGITVPNTDAPTEYESEVLRDGDGATIGDSDIVIVKYTAVNWDTQAVTDSTWQSQSVGVYNLSGTDVGDGVRQAVEGEKVGSQILAVIPPELSGPGGATATDSTEIYVIDILGTIG